MKIQVEINEAGALRNLRHAFSNRYTLVSELLQNARRAGARCIEVHHDADNQVLCVQDDGRGLDNFQKLLSLHETGWDAATCALERPFGVGFSKCLYAATRCVVSSGLQRVDIDTTAALAKALVDVEQATDEVTGTRVELHGVHLPELASRIEELCAGFPVPVLYNGRPLTRSLAEAHLAMQPSAIGSVHLTGTHDGKCSHDTVVFLQGFCVLKPSFWSLTQVNVVHLDPQQFMARLPDRDKLIDEDVQRKRIDAELKTCWRKTLQAAKAQMPAERFLDLYYPVLRGWDQLDLMNDLDVLPARLCKAIVGYPTQDDRYRPDYLEVTSKPPSRHDVESGAVKLVVLDPVDDSNGARWMMARAKHWLVFDWLGVHNEHWVQQHLRFLEEERVRLEPVSEVARTTLEGRAVWPTVILCESVQLKVGNEEALITGEGVCHQGTVYMPAGENTGLPVQQLSSYTDDNDRFMASDQEADREALADLVFRLRSLDPVQALESLLIGLNLGKYPLLRGKSFRLTVGSGAAPGHSIELMPPEATATTKDEGADRAGP